MILARNAMMIQEFRSTLSGKQSDESPDTSRLSNVPSELPYLGSKRLFVASSDVRFGSILLKNSGHENLPRI